MRTAGWRVTAGIAVATLVVSGLIIVNGMVDALAPGWGFVPALTTGGVSLPPGVLAAPIWLTPLTASLIHGGWAHLALNLLMLVYCGQQAERTLGPAAIAVLYGVGAYAAAAGQWVQGPASMAPTIGASGAISAIVAAYALLYGRRHKGVSEIGHALWLGAAWIGIQVLVGIAGIGGVTVAVGAHIGGFIAGLVLTKPLLMWHYRRA